jgi:isopentenyl-diphosphate delta-isomerase
MNSVKNQGKKIVSSEDELLILVDDDDSDVGFLSKAACHDGGGVLHRAFSVFLFNDAGELLLQQRGAEKRLWPGFWSNSCCSHPRKGETLGYATSRRLQEELNIGADLEFVYKFIYQAGYGDVGSEHELCSVYLGRLRDVARANTTEIDALRYVAADELQREFVTSPEHFTPWFKLEWQHLNDHHVESLSRYTCPA